MKRLVIYPELCSGCSACEVFCSLHHESKVNPELSRIHVIKDEAHAAFLPVVCVSCKNKACLAACPEQGAIYINHLGMTVIEETLCTGCSKCAQACEIHAIRFFKQSGRGKWGKAFCFKCDLCAGDPVCVKACPQGALAVKDIADDGEAAQNLYEQLRQECTRIIEWLDECSLVKNRRAV